MSLICKVTLPLPTFATILHKRLCFQTGNTSKDLNLRHIYGVLFHFTLKTTLILFYLNSTENLSKVD